jgi:hypothetical protein
MNMSFLRDLVPARLRTWLLPALCLLIAGALAAVFMFNVPVDRLLLWTMVLVCPLSHLLFGHGGHGSAEEHTHHNGEGAAAAGHRDQ